MQMRSSKSIQTPFVPRAGIHETFLSEGSSRHPNINLDSAGLDAQVPIPGQYLAQTPSLKD